MGDALDRGVIRGFPVLAGVLTAVVPMLGQLAASVLMLGMQVLSILSGVFVPMMFLVGAIFAGGALLAAVAVAIASRDFMPVHHDRDYAKKQGSPDLFMNILTTNGLVEKFVVDWAGPDTELKGIAIRLGAPAHPYDTLTFSGRTYVVSEAPVADAERLVWTLVTHPS